MEGTPAFVERVELGLRMARTAGDILMDSYGELTRWDRKGEIDFVSDADREAEAHIAECVSRSYPDDGWFAEESGEPRPGTSGYRWIVDPLDGTTNFIHGYPVFTVSVALERRGRIVFGCVHAPFYEETFHAVRGGGAFRNGRPIRVSRVDAIDDALLVTGFPYNRREVIDELLARVRRALMSAHGLRRSGSAAYDLCCIAAGRADGFWEQGLHPWDVAAGSLLITEAGGAVTDFDGGPHDISARRTLASNGLLHEALRAVLFGEGAR